MDSDELDFSNSQSPKGRKVKGRSNSMGNRVKWDEITLIYKLLVEKNEESEEDMEEEKEEIQTKYAYIFGTKFVENNRDNCKIIFNKKEIDLMEGLTLQTNAKTLEIRLKGLSNVTNMSYMFNNCPQLVSIYNLDKIDTSEVTDMNSMIQNCRTLTKIPDISKWNPKMFQIWKIYLMLVNH